MLQNTFNPHKWFTSAQFLLLLNKGVSNVCIKQQNNSVGDTVYTVIHRMPEESHKRSQSAWLELSSRLETGTF